MSAQCCLPAKICSVHINCLKACFILLTLHALGAVEEESCIPPRINEAVAQADFCKVLRRICIHQDSLVSFDPGRSHRFGQPTNVRVFGAKLPYLHTWTSSWNIPGPMNSDAIVGNQDAYALPFRPSSRLEAAPALQQHPGPGADPLYISDSSFSNCTLPAVLLADWPFNFCEFFANGASTADLWFRKLQMLPGRDVTLALALPAGLGLMPFHQALLGHLSIHPITTLERMAADAGAAEREARDGGVHATRVSWSHDGVPRSCFNRLLVCKLQGTGQSSPLETANAVAAHLDSPASGGTMPKDPLDFGAEEVHAAADDGGGDRSGWGGGGSRALPPLGQDSTLRVAVDVRRGGVRTLRNLHQLLDACNHGAWSEVGGFRRVICRPLVTYDTPDAAGLNRFRATIAAVRSSHVLVAVHGAGAANGFFLRPDGETAAALLEVRPCGFGSGYTWWVDAHMAINLPRLGDEVRFHAYNIEDPDQCSPADWVHDMHHATSPVNTRAGDGHVKRDQHLTLRPDGFMSMLRYVAGMLRNRTAYDTAKAAKRLHGYALPGDGAHGVDEEGSGSRIWGKSGGVILGPVGMANFSEVAASGTASFILWPG